MPNLTLQQMQDFALVDGDFVFSDDGYTLRIEGAERVAQHVQYTLSTQKGTWYLDLAFGTPWIGEDVPEEITLLGSNPDIPAIRSVLSLIILSVPDLESIEELNLDFDPAAQSLLVGFKGLTSAGDAVTGELTV